MHFELVLETNHSVSADRALAVCASLVRAIKSAPDFPASGQVEIVEAGRGSFRITLAIFGILGGAASVGSLTLDIVDRLKQPGSEIARCVAWTMIEDGVTKVGVRCERQFEISREDMPAVRVLLDEQLAQTQEDMNEEPAAHGDDEDLADRTASSGHAADWKAPDFSDFVNIPADPDSVVLPGRFRQDHGQTYFVQSNGQVALLEEDEAPGDFPMDLPVLVRLGAVRGPRGGWADRRVRIAGWTLPQSDVDDRLNLDAQGFERSETTPERSDRQALTHNSSAQAFVGRIWKSEDSVLLTTDAGDVYILEGQPNHEHTGTGYVVIGTLGPRDDHGMDRLNVVGIYPLYP